MAMSMEMETRRWFWSTIGIEMGMAMGMRTGTVAQILL